MTLSIAAGQAACGGSGGTTTNSSGTGGSSGSHASGSGGSGNGGSGLGGSFFVSSSTGTGTGGAQQQGFDVQPAALQTITVNVGQPAPTVAYTATLDGHPISAGWGVDYGNIGTIPSAPASSATFTPTGKAGGLVNVLAGLNGTTLKRPVLVQLVAQQNGADPSNPATTSQIATNVGQIKAGGGIGGVGGEGLGGAVADAGTITALGAPGSDGSAEQLKLLYPYDKTVWPRGLLAPNLQWSWATGDADAIQIKLSTASGSFSWTGTFGRPAILAQTGGKFIRHPIPQDVWKMATDSAGGPTPNNTPDTLTVSLTIALGGQAYGPIKQTWTVAPARLAGTVYYNSYGTQLVLNSNDNQATGQQYGAAVLAIKGGDTGPSVVAGTQSSLAQNGSGCRVCHVVASDGSRLIVQHGDIYSRTSTYDLKNQNAETPLTGYDSTFGWAGLSPDGKLALTNAADLAAAAPSSRLYTFPPTSTTPLAAQGIPSNLQAGTPAFSPDGKHVAFDFMGGTIGTTTGNGTQLVALDFDQATLSFSNLRVLATMPDASKRAGFPSFFPTNDAVAYHYQIVASNHRYNTWHQAKAQIWWSDMATGTAAVLGALNGLDGATSYLPTGPNNHANDTELNYEPTVNPIASGGYVWVIFTSRRLYGNVATTDPWLSDPRSYDATNIANTTTKKLWVAAIDLNAQPGTDPSHPAFYLPAQELLAGNARGFWVLDPCKPDGQGCESGDQCCNGFCQPDANDTLVCSNMNPNSNCSAPQEKCTTAADCCDPTNTCVNGFCTQKGVN
ncbi:Hypothetical protein A7982_05545 [Minicystis rosea]|nr:Hypothetical protein A7982_05545 [Minicystis rosea]